MPGYARMSTDSPEVITTTVGVIFYRGFCGGRGIACNLSRGAPQQFCFHSRLSKK